MMRRFSRSQHGATMVEFAMALPIFIALTTACIDIGAALNVKASQSRAAADSLRIAAGMPPGRLDDTTPATADARAIATVFSMEMGGLDNKIWSLAVDELVAGGTARSIATGGDSASCPLPDAPNMSALNLVAGERIAVLRTCLNWNGPIAGGLLAHHNFVESIALPMHRSIPQSCKTLYDGGQRQNGIYRIDTDGPGPKPSLEVKCDMTHGGWTLVAAQFETTPVTNWNAGTTSGTYDPTLGGDSFALSSNELPPHSSMSLALNNDPSTGIIIPIPYTTGNIALTTVTAANGQDYQIHRDQGQHYKYLDPDSNETDPEARSLVTTPGELNNCLILDRVGVTGFDWWFCPNASSPADRGAAFGGSDRRGVSDAAAWTIWVR